MGDRCVLVILERQEDDKTAPVALIHLSRQTMVNFLTLSPSAVHLLTLDEDAGDGLADDLLGAVSSGKVNRVLFLRVAGIADKIGDIHLLHLMLFAEKWIPPVAEGGAANKDAWRPIQTPLRSYDITTLLPTWVIQFYQLAFYDRDDTKKKQVATESQFDTFLEVPGKINTKFDPLPTCPGNLPIDRMLQMVDAVEYFQIDPVSDVVCALMAIWTVDKQPEEIREKMGVHGTLEPNEEAQIRATLAWLQEPL